MKKKNIVIFGVFLAVAFALMYFGARTPKTAATWPGTDVACLPNGHVNVTSHTHTGVLITVDGSPEIVPASIGVAGGCMAEVHTHETDGQIHVEYVGEPRDFTLGDFFEVWGRDVAREGFGLTVYVNDAKVWGPTADEMTVDPPENITLRDHETIRLEYESKG